MKQKPESPEVIAKRQQAQEMCDAANSALLQQKLYRGPVHESAQRAHLAMMHRDYDTAYALARSVCTVLSGPKGLLPKERKSHDQNNPANQAADDLTYNHLS